MSEFWENLKDIDEALDAILTGYEGPVEDMPVYQDVVRYLKHTGSILDFGCGAGRNIAYLKDYYTRVYGYDYPNMLKFVSRQTLEDENVYLTSDLNSVYAREYDEVLLSLVLQHIHIDELREILEELSLCSRRFIIHSRVWIDFTLEPILPVLEEFFDIDVIEYKKDPNSEEDDHFIGVFVPRS
jgi:SAM-dependent methyltransferase